MRNAKKGRPAEFRWRTADPGNSPSLEICLDTRAGDHVRSASGMNIASAASTKQRVSQNSAGRAVQYGDAQASVQMQTEQPTTFHRYTRGSNSQV